MSRNFFLKNFAAVLCESCKAGFTIGHEFKHKFLV